MDLYSLIKFHSDIAIISYKNRRCDFKAFRMCVLCSECVKQGVCMWNGLWPDIMIRLNQIRFVMNMR